MHADKPKFSIKSSNGLCAFGVMEHETHSTIAGKDNGPVNSDTLTNMLTALEIEDEGFEAWCKQLQHANQYVMSTNAGNRYKQGFQNTVVYLDDQYQKSISDYFLEFFAERTNDDVLAETFHGQVIQSVHAYQDNPSYRSLFINCTRLQEMLTQGHTQMHVSITATPIFNPERNQLVGYSTYDKDNYAALLLDKKHIEWLFQPNRTLFIKLKIKRRQAKEIFTINACQITPV